jgi:hypothetical protein
MTSTGRLSCATVGWQTCIGQDEAVRAVDAIIGRVTRLIGSNTTSASRYYSTPKYENYSVSAPCEPP